MAEQLVVTEWIEGDGTYGTNNVAIVGKLAVRGEGSLTLNNYPNPFEDITTIEFSIPDDGHVTLVPFNSLGEEQEVIVDAQYLAGNHQVRFGASGLAAGNYIIRMETNGQSIVKAVQVIR